MKKYISTLVSKIVDVLIGVGVVAILFCVYNIISLKNMDNNQDDKIIKGCFHEIYLLY